MAYRSSRSRGRNRRSSGVRRRSFSSRKSRGGPLRANRSRGNTLRLVIHHTGVQPGAAEASPEMLKAALFKQNGPRKAVM